jgi:phospholipase/carboxylesterase
VIVFHGRGGSAERGLGLLRDAADANGLLLLAPEAAGETWDVLHDGTFGADVRALDRALEQVFAHYAVDSKLIATAGFSDGASYALSVGLTNGQLVTHVLAYSPGLLRVQTPEGAPSVFLSHGSEDRDLPIAATSRLVVPALRKNGYQVRFDEFRGGHSIPPDLLRDSVGWFLGRQPSGPAFVPAVGTQRERAAPILPVARH